MSDETTTPTNETPASPDLGTEEGRLNAATALLAKAIPQDTDGDNEGDVTTPAAKPAAPPAEDDQDPRLSRAFATLRRKAQYVEEQARQVQAAKRAEDEQRKQWTTEANLLEALRAAKEDPTKFFEVARRVGLDPQHLANHLYEETKGETRAHRQLEEKLAKAEKTIQDLQQHWEKEEQAKIEAAARNEEQAHLAAVQQTKSAFIDFVDQNPEKYPHLFDSDPSIVAESFMYWAAEEHKATGRAPTFDAVARFLEPHAQERLAARRARKKPASVLEQPSGRQVTEATREPAAERTLANDDAAESGSMGGAIPDIEVRKRKAARLLAGG
jgi:hypothetical protein